MVFGENPLSNNIEPEDNLEPDTLDNPSKQETAPVSEELFVREVPPEYQKLIDIKDKFIESGEQYSRHLAPDLRSNKELMSLIQQRVEGESVLDLGSGSLAYMLSMSIEDWKAKQYIGVDLHRIVIEDTVEHRDTSKDIGYVPLTQSQSLENAEIPLDDDEGGDYNPTPKPKPPVQTKSEIVISNEEQVAIKGDMLDAISRLEDSSIGAVILSGIEGNSIEEGMSEYMKKLKQEIHRVLKTDGLFIVYESDISADKENFNKVFPSNQSNNQYTKYESTSVFEKIENEYTIPKSY